MALQDFRRGHDDSERGAKLVRDERHFTDRTRHDSKLDENLMNVGFGLGFFIAVGQGGALSTSPDGVEWTARTVPHSGFIWDVCTDPCTVVE